MTMATIAKAAGVSQGAISSLLNDRDYGIRVSEKTRERVFRACRELNYVPNDLRAVVRIYPEQGDTCLLISSRIPGGLAHPWVSRIATGMLNTIPMPRHNLAVAYYEETRNYVQETEELPQPLKNGTGSKFVCFGPINTSLHKACIRRNFPVIQLGYESTLPGVVSMVPDYGLAAQLALGHLARHGHKNIAIVSGPFGSADPRDAELNRAIGISARELGLQIEAQNIFQGDLSYQAGAAAMDALIGRTPAPTAIFCLSEASAMGARSRAEARSVGVPGILSILALTDHTDASPGTPALTTVAVPGEELGAEAAMEADRIIRSGAVTEARKIILPVRLIERASSGPVRI